MGRLIALLYGLLSYIVFFGTFVYAVGFVSGIGVPKDINAGRVVPLVDAIITNLLLLAVFALGTAESLGVRRWAGYDWPGVSRAGDPEWGGFCAW
jgi:hypothetical protein